MLADNPSQQCDESDSGACPDGVNGAGRNGLERERQEVERDCVAGDDDDARPQRRVNLPDDFSAVVAITSATMEMDSVKYGDI